MNNYKLEALFKAEASDLPHIAHNLSLGLIELMNMGRDTHVVMGRTTLSETVLFSPATMTDTAETMSQIDGDAHQMRKLAEKIAYVAHQVHRMQTLAMGMDHVPEWEEATKDYIDGSVHLTLAFIRGKGQFTPMSSHELWYADKIAQGWVWGSERNEQSKTHPDLIEWAKLPPERRLFSNTHYTITMAMMNVQEVL